MKNWTIATICAGVVWGAIKLAETPLQSLPILPEKRQELLETLLSDPLFSNLRTNIVQAYYDPDLKYCRKRLEETARTLELQGETKHAEDTRDLIRLIGVSLKDGVLLAKTIRGEYLLERKPSIFFTQYSFEERRIVENEGDLKATLAHELFHAQNYAVGFSFRPNCTLSKSPIFVGSFSDPQFARVMDEVSAQSGMIELHTTGLLPQSKRYNYATSQAYKQEREHLKKYAEKKDQNSAWAQAMLCSTHEE